MNRCKVKIQDGKITIGKENVRDLVRSKKDGYYSFTLKDWDRSLSQNAYYWMCLGIIGDYLGYHRNEIHEEMIRMFSPIITYRRLDGKPQQQHQRTSDMSVKEMTRHIELMIQFASEQNIILPEPEN